jgi:hypothetical protein
MAAISSAAAEVAGSDAERDRHAAVVTSVIAYCSQRYVSENQADRWADLASPCSASCGERGQLWCRIVPTLHATMRVMRAALA